MRPVRIVIHAGFHKTGTSTVQQTLKQNRPRLKPYMQSVLKGQMHDLLHAARGYSTWRDPFTLEKFSQRFSALIERFAPTDGRCLCLSAEELAGHLPGRSGIPDYGAAPVLASEMTRIVTSLHPEVDLHFFYSTRTDGWLRSAYWEHVKASSMTMSWDAFAESFATAADLSGIVEAVSHAQPAPVDQADLDDTACECAGPATPVLKLCGVPDDTIAGLKILAPVNRALDTSVLLALLAANRDYADPDTRKAAKQAILKAAQESDSD